MSISVEARGLDELTARLAKQRTTLPADLELLIDQQLLQIRRELVAATPIGSWRLGTFTLPSGRVVQKTVKAHESMAASWHKQRSGLTGKVWNDKPYAQFLFVDTKAHAIPGAFGYPAPFGESPTFHPGTHANQGLIDAFEGQVQDASARFRQFGYEVVGKIAGKTVGG